MLAVIQARWSSKRLPGKVLKLLGDRPLLGWTVSRLQQSKMISEIVLATSELATDDPVAAYGHALGLEVYRGALDDVAARFCAVVQDREAQAFVRICGDSPLIDPLLVDQAVNLYQTQDCDLVTNVFPRSFPKGQSVELIRSSSFLSIWDYVPLSEREHITQIYYRFPEQFRIINFSSEFNASTVQLSIDTLEDYQIIQQIIQQSEGTPGTWKDLVAIRQSLINEFSA